MIETAEIPPAVITPEMEALFKVLEEQHGYDRLDLEEMLAFMQAGGTYGEFFGYSPEIYNSIEEIALTHYRAQQYEKALTIFTYVRNLSHDTRISALRGAGACHQALKDYNTAIAIYRLALSKDPNELLCQLFCGESLVQVGALADGMIMLEKAVATPDLPAKMLPYLTRARAILEAQRAKGPQPAFVQPEFTQPVNVANVKSVPQAQKVADHPDAAAGPAMMQALNIAQHLANGEAETLEDLMDDPDYLDQLDDLTEGYKQGHITLREIAGFTDEQFDGGYAAACKFLEMGKPIDALQLVGWLLWLDPRQARLYHLGGLCTHHLKLWCLADYLYGRAIAYDPENPISYIYQGETKLMMEERREGLELVRQGLTRKATNPDAVDAHKRGQILLKQFEKQNNKQIAE